MLLNICKIMKMQTNTPTEEAKEEVKEAVFVALNNPIGMLQEMCTSKRWPPPLYKLEREDGLPHVKEFTISCQVMDFRELGIGRSKKSAKKLAAHKMWQKLKDMPIEGVQVLCEETTNDSLNVQSRYEGLKCTKIARLDKRQSQKIYQFYKCIKPTSGKMVKNLQRSSLNTKDFNYINYLNELAAELKIVVNYVDINNKSLFGKHQCLVELNNLPVAVCHGAGENFEEARCTAAHNAIEYLKMMIKK